ncbi:MAG: TolC family protein [Brachymonas sp.]|nr:TolC family protein [Brachymonas sp.]
MKTPSIRYAGPQAALHSRQSLRPLSLAAVLAAVMLAGCSLTPKYERPLAPVAGHWPSAPGSASAAAQGVAAASAPVASALPWQNFVQDARLRSVIDLALANNRDLRIAIKNIELAQAQYRISRADLGPTLGASASGTRSSSNTSPRPGAPSVASSYTAGLGISDWEIDLFGRLRALSDSALNKYLATEEARKTAQISLVGAVSSAWLSLQANNELLALAERTLSTREQSQTLTKLRLDAGVSSALDMRQAEALSAAAQAAVAQQRRLREQDINLLTLLVGQALGEEHLPPAPDALALPAAQQSASIAQPMQAAQAKVKGRKARAVPNHAANGAADGTAASAAQAAIPTASRHNTLAQFADVAVGLPSDVLLNRPDIRAAEQQLIAANANIGAARAAFFPRITLTGNYGNVSPELADLFSGGATRAWAFMPKITLPIFDWGRLRANLKASEAGRDIALAQYEKAIQTGFREVADALAGRATLGEQLAALEAQAAASRDSYRLAELRYRNGIASYLHLLDAQRTLFSTEQALVQTRLLQRLNQVTLYKALGGGWTAPAQTSVAEAATASSDAKAAANPSSAASAPASTAAQTSQP